MTKNIGQIDRIIRLILFVILALLFFTKTVTGTFGLTLLLFGTTLLTTGGVSFCPIYTVLGIRTDKEDC